MLPSLGLAAVYGDQTELFHRDFEIRNDLFGEDIGIREIVRVVEGIVLEQ